MRNLDSRGLQLVQAYSTSPTMKWSTVGHAPGTYRISIWARDASSSGTDGNQFGRWDTYNNNLAYTLSTCSALSLSVGRGTSVKVTAQASGCPNPNPVYQFWVLAPGGSAYQLVQAYSTSNGFTWNTTGLAAGGYTFSVWVRDADSTGAQGNQVDAWDAYHGTVFTLN